ncbi:hypothetical protein Drose_05750 [Dactylosporangium roseum]|uniref:Uncharacterized protein n=1 Tax=Dactylosporangium roseum TaxID=47989 RepID=A0ABY5Z803_9ACTN|nr:hypothetical protein [Dactylosporangium roseum]UWZ37774.1 hypothetical protein Drose_05750 [Dactylosporangium roseum]
MSNVHITTDGDTLWLECHGHQIRSVEPGDTWDELLAAVQRHQCTGFHGPDGPRHGYMHGECGDYCNNLACPAGQTHEVCTPECDGDLA